MEPYFLSWVGVIWDPHTHTPNTCPPVQVPPTRPPRSSEALFGCQWGTQSRKGTGARGQRGGAYPQAHPWGLRTQRAEIHAASVTHPSLAIGASRRAPRGRDAGRAAPGARALPAEGNQKSRASGSKS